MGKMHELLKKKLQVIEGDKRALDEQATGRFECFPKIYRSNL